MIELFIRTIPIAEPRKRITAMRNRAGRAIVRAYTPKSHPSVQFKSDVRTEISSRKIDIIDEPVIIDAHFFLPRPRRLMRKKDKSYPVLCDKKPDRDNLDKSLLDALTGILIKDDAQVVGGTIYKWYCAKPGEYKPFDSPGVYVRIRTVDEVFVNSLVLFNMPFFNLLE